VTYALAYFLPIILHDKMGFSIGESQCLVAPPYAFAGIVMYATGWAGDKYRIRGPIIVFNMLVCIIGLPIMGFAKSPAVQYFGVFLTTAGANSNIPAAMSYQANNIRGQWKRAFCSATLVGFGGIGGIAGGLVFRTQDAPNYRPGIYACIACCVLSIIIVGLLTLKFKRANAKAERGEIELETSDVSFAFPRLLEISHVLSLCHLMSRFLSIAVIVRGMLTLIFRTTNSPGSGTPSNRLGI
jgi:hypothetical protein